MGWNEDKVAGNAAVQRGANADAVSLYSSALSDSALPTSERCTLLANRALAFLKLGKNDKVIEDCTACLMHSPNHVKALFRRAAAYEALKDTREALRDYEATLAADPTVTDAALGRTRCEVALGLTPTQGGAVVPSATRAAQKSRISEEDARSLNEAQTRVREVKKQQLRSSEQKRQAENDKRRAELTLAQLSQLPEGRAVYTSVGRMYARSSISAATAKLDEDRAGFEKKIRVCNLTIDHLAKQEKEADSTFLEVLASIKRKGGN